MKWICTLQLLVFRMGFSCVKKEKITIGTLPRRSISIVCFYHITVYKISKNLSSALWILNRDLHTVLVHFEDGSDISSISPWNPHWNGLSPGIQMRVLHTCWLTMVAAGKENVVIILPYLLTSSITSKTLHTIMMVINLEPDVAHHDLSITIFWIPLHMSKKTTETRVEEVQLYSGTLTFWGENRKVSNWILFMGSIIYIYFLVVTFSLPTTREIVTWDLHSASDHWSCVKSWLAPPWKLEVGDRIL